MNEEKKSSLRRSRYSQQGEILIKPETWWYRKVGQETRRASERGTEGGKERTAKQDNSQCEQTPVSANFYVFVVDNFRILGDLLIKKVITFSFHFCGEYTKHGVTIQRQSDLLIISAEHRPYSENLKE
jgi:hypothetical protein